MTIKINMDTDVEADEIESCFFSICYWATSALNESNQEMIFKKQTTEDIELKETCDCVIELNNNRKRFIQQLEASMMNNNLEII